MVIIIYLATFWVNLLVKNDVFERFFLLIMGSIVLGMGMNAFDDNSVLFIVFFLVGRLWCILCKIPFLIQETEYRLYFLINILFNTLPCILLIIGIAVESVYQNMIVVFVIVELILYYVFNLIIKFVVRPKKTPAINVKHAKDRIGLFTIVVLGEITFSLLIDSTSFNAFCLSVLGLIVASRIQYLYFKSESEGNNIEQVKGENRLFAPFWFFLHLPLQCAIALSGASLAVVVHDTARIENPAGVIYRKVRDTHINDDFEFSKTLYFSTLAMVMLSLAIMTIIQKKICGHKFKDWRMAGISGCLILCFIFIGLAILTKFIGLSVFVVSIVSAILMLGLSSMEEFHEAQLLWRSK